MNKRPSLQFYPGDWWRANDIKSCSMSTQGVWINLLFVMWDAPERGKISAKPREFRRILGANSAELRQFYVENALKKFAEVTTENGITTIINRRMYREYLHLKKDADRKRLSLASTSHPENIHLPSSSSSSTSYTYTLQQVIDTAILIGISEDKATAFYHHYNAQGWVRANSQPIADLQSQLINWRNNQYKFEAKDGSGKTRTSNGRTDRTYIR